MSLRVCQMSIFKRPNVVAYDELGSVVGEMNWPVVGQARNARLKWHQPGSRAGEVEVVSAGSRYRIGLEYLSRGWQNDTRFILDGPYDDDGQTLGTTSATLAVADWHVAPGGPSKQSLVVHQPFAGRFERRSGLLRVRWEVLHGDLPIGTVSERSWFMLRREIIVDLPSRIDVPTQMFFFFVMFTMSYS